MAKLGVVIEEADECAFWMELIVEGKVMTATRVGKLMAEANEITAILNASRKTAVRRAATIKPKG